MIIAGVVLGLFIFVLSVWVNLRVVENARSMPPQEASNQMVIQYVIRVAILMVSLGILTYWMGIELILGVLGGMVLGILLFLVISRSNRSMFERWIKRPKEKD